MGQIILATNKRWTVVIITKFETGKMSVKITKTLYEETKQKKEKGVLL